jgi:Fe-S-cluster-containing hydrogenase component 2
VCMKATEKTQEVARKSGRIVHDPTACISCGICELVCAVYHDGSSSPSLRRLWLVRDPFNVRYIVKTCMQCNNFPCYFACPLKDEALCIDEKTGISYINPDECIGCKECIEACPFNPPRIGFNKKGNVAIKCDLCRERENGPICVEFCPGKALTYVRDG